MLFRSVRAVAPASKPLDRRQAKAFLMPALKNTDQTFPLRVMVTSKTASWAEAY